MYALMRWKPSPSMAVAMIALFVALGGTASGLTGSNTVQSDDLGPGAQVTAPDVAANAVNGTDVVDNSVTGADVNEASLSSSVLQRRVTDSCPPGESIRAIDATGTVVTCETVGGGGNPTGPAGGDLAGSTYPDPTIAAGAISGGAGGKISDDTITDDDLAGAAQFNGAAAGGDLGGTYPSPEIAANAVGTNEVGFDALTSADLAGNSVGSSELVSGSVFSPEVAFDTLTSFDLAGNSVNSGARPGLGHLTRGRDRRHRIVRDHQQCGRVLGARPGGAGQVHRRGFPGPLRPRSRIPLMRRGEPESSGCRACPTAGQRRLRRDGLRRGHRDVPDQRAPGHSVNRRQQYAFRSGR